MDMRSVAPMKTAKIGYIVMSVLFCVLGVVLLFTPGVSALWIGRLLGMIRYRSCSALSSWRGTSPATCSGWPFSTIWPSACC